MLDLVVPDMETQPSRFFRELYPPVLRFLGGIAGSLSAEVEDLVQETLLHAWKNYDSLRDESRRIPWVLAIARHKMQDRWRRERHRRAADEDLSRIADLSSDPLPQELIDSHEMGSKVQQALGRMPQEYATLLIRRHAERESVKSIAKSTGETPKGVEMKLYRARSAFRRMLEELLRS